MFLTTEPDFDIVVQKNGAVSVVLAARGRSPLRPRVVHDGKSMAVVFRDGDEAIGLTEIPRPAFKKLRKSRLVQITELSDSSRLVWNYAAKVEKDKSLARRIVR
jgi:hypothetical protein